MPKNLQKLSQYSTPLKFSHVLLSGGLVLQWTSYKVTSKASKLSTYVKKPSLSLLNCKMWQEYFFHIVHLYTFQRESYKIAWKRFLFFVFVLYCFVVVLGRGSWEWRAILEFNQCWIYFSSSLGVKLNEAMCYSVTSMYTENFHAIFNAHEWNITQNFILVTN